MADFSNIVPRERYITKIKPFMHQPLIKVLTGQRRVGKSYILFLLMDNILKANPDANIIYINCEDINFNFIKNALDLNDYILSKKIKNQNSYIFIDEIQDIEDFEKALR